MINEMLHLLTKLILNLSAFTLVTVSLIAFGIAIIVTSFLSLALTRSSRIVGYLYLQFAIGMILVILGLLTLLIPGLI